MIANYLALLFKLLVGHAVSDFALQSDFMARGKNRHNASPGYDPKGHGRLQVIWPYVLGAHALIHGGAVYLATGSALLGAIETVLHAGIDFGKCEKWYGIHSDQVMHLACKLFYLCAL